MSSPGSLLLSRLMGGAKEESKAHILICGNSLKVSNPSLGLDGCASLLQAVQQNPTLTEINLTGCNISKGDELSEIIKSCQHLRRLVLDGNCIGLARTGISSLTSAIALSPTLKEIDLRNNRMGPSFAAALANALRSTRSLAFIDLRWNNIGPSGAAALINLLQKNPVITSIQLAGNGIPQKLLSQIDKIIEDNRAGLALPQVRPHYQHPMEDELKPVNREGMEAIYSGRAAALVEELNNLKIHLESLKKERDESKMEVVKAENQVKALRLELTEENLLRKYADKEANIVKEELSNTKQELGRAQQRIAEDARLASETLNVHNAALAEVERREKAAQELHAAAVLDSTSLKQQLISNKNEYSTQLHSLEEKANAEVQKCQSVVKKLESEISERDEAHAKEVNLIRLELTAERKQFEGEKEAALRETEGLKCIVSSVQSQFAAKESALQQEKENAEQVLNARVANVRAEMEELQADLDNMRREVTRARKKHTSEMEEYETTIAQQRTLQHRLELTKSDLEEKIFSLTSEKIQLQERNKLSEDRERLLEKKIELERLKYSEQSSGEISRHMEDKRRLENELQSTKIHLHNTRNQLEELQAEQERKKLEVEKRVLGVETAFIECIRKQFSGLRTCQPHNFDTYTNP